MSSNENQHVGFILNIKFSVIHPFNWWMLIWLLENKKHLLFSFCLLKLLLKYLKNVDSYTVIQFTSNLYIYTKQTISTMHVFFFWCNFGIYTKSYLFVSVPTRAKISAPPIPSCYWGKLFGLSCHTINKLSTLF